MLENCYRIRNEADSGPHFVLTTRTFCVLVPKVGLQIVVWVRDSWGVFVPDSLPTMLLGDC
jgi:hypothetical protein